MPSNRTTIKDMAAMLNVSPSTVSRALKDSHQIGSATKQAVWALAKKMNYKPNLIAKRLLTKKSHIIGVVVPDVSYYFNSEAIRGIEDILLKQGFNLMMCQTHESYELEVRHCEYLLANQVDGLIASVSGETQEFAHFRSIQKAGVPIVLFDRGFSIPNISKIMIDNTAAAKQGVKHLLDIGCRRIAYLMGPANMPLTHARKRGYKKALEEAGITFDPDLLKHCQFSTDMGLSNTMDLLKLVPRPDAIFAINDRIGIGVLAAIDRLGLRVPEDIAVLGFNNEPYSALLKPGLSTILQPAYKMGQEAAKMLLNQFQDQHLSSQTKILRTKLIIRASTSIRQL